MDNSINIDDYWGVCEYCKQRQKLTYDEENKIVVVKHSEASISFGMCRGGGKPPTRLEKK